MDDKPVAWTINLDLVWKCGLSQLQVFFCIGEDGLQRATQKLLVEILRCSHQRRKRHGHLHLDSGKVLKTAPREGKARNEVRTPRHRQQRTAPPVKMTFPTVRCDWLFSGSPGQYFACYLLYLRCQSQSFAS